MFVYPSSTYTYYSASLVITFVSVEIDEDAYVAPSIKTPPFSTSASMTTPPSGPSMCPLT